MRTPPIPAQAARVLVLDDEPDLRTLYELTLLREGYRVEAAGDLQQARELLHGQKFDAVITDMRLPDGLGLELLREISAQQRTERCVVITAHGSAENAVEALKAGAFDYLTKPVDLKQFRSVVAAAIQGGSRMSAMPSTAVTAPATTMQAGTPTIPSSPAAGIHNAQGKAILQKLVGESAVMQAAKARIAKAAGGMAPILVQGESGTGKELVARAIHGCSHRHSGPFVAVNCGAIPENLLEAEFFGARKGAYTGATQDREGYFQAAKGGTLFLDEIGDLPLAMQSKLLRAIQERMVRPLGSSQEVSVDVRIVSATHKNLAQEVQAGTFRQDLYYRLNVIDIAVPALRERREDLPALCQSLLTRICQDSGVAVPKLSAEFLSQLQNHPFLGNVRELENLLHRAVALGDGNDLQLDVGAAYAPEKDSASGGQATQSVVVPENLQSFLDQQERDILIAVLQETGFNRTAAAAKLGLSLRQIRYRIARLNIAMRGDDATPEEDLADDLA